MAFLGESPSAAGVPAAPRDWQAGLPLQPSSHTPGEAGSPLTAQGMNWCSPVENSPRVPARSPAPATLQLCCGFDTVLTGALSWAPPRDAHDTAFP